MKTWIIEHFSEENGLQYLIESLKNQGHLVKEINWLKKDDPITPKNEGDIIFFGSQEIGQNYKDQELVFLGTNNFLCSKYNNFPHLLNNSEFMVLSDVLNNKAELFLKYPNGFFIRPNSWEKHFAGQVITLDSFDTSWKRINSYVYEPIRVCISPIVEILEEYRVLCINNKLVTSSIYKKEGKSFQEERDVGMFQSLFETILEDNILPSHSCTIDIAKTCDGLKLIEFNPLSTSAIYKCNPELIIKALLKEE